MQRKHDSLKDNQNFKKNLMEEQSKEMFVALANDNFATWQNSIIKNLAKAQIKTNL